MADDIKVTVRGWVATDPLRIETKKGAFTQFRLAHTPRYYDPSSATWADGQTEWFTVVMDRDNLVANAGFSVHKSIPVIVLGTLRTSAWVNAEGVERRTMEIRAETVGVDLTFGITSFIRSRAKERVTAGEGEGPGIGIDLVEPAPRPASAGHGASGGPDEPADQAQEDARSKDGEPAAVT